MFALAQAIRVCESCNCTPTSVEQMLDPAHASSGTPHTEEGLKRLILGAMDGDPEAQLELTNFGPFMRFVVFWCTCDIERM